MVFNHELLILARDRNRYSNFNVGLECGYMGPDGAWLYHQQTGGPLKRARIEN